MEVNKDNNRLKMLELITGEENNLVLYDALHDKDLTKFFYLLKQGYALTPFILNCLIDFGYEKNLVKAIHESVRVSFRIYEFLCAYWGQDKAEDFLVKNNLRNVIKEKFSTETLVKCQLWNILLEKGEYSELYRQKQYDLLKKSYAEASVEEQKKIAETMKKLQAVDFLAEVGAWHFLQGYPKGNSKLIECKEWEYLIDLRNLQHFDWPTRESIFQKVCDNGGDDYLYKSLSSHPCLKEFLLERKYYSHFIADKRWYELAEAGAFDAIDWEDFYLRMRGNERFCEFAAKAGKWDFLAAHHEHWFLFLKKQFRWWWKSFN